MVESVPVADGEKCSKCKIMEKGMCRMYIISGNQDSAEFLGGTVRRSSVEPRSQQSR